MVLYQFYVGMAIGKICADSESVDPHPRAKTRARNTPRVQKDTNALYPRIPVYPQVRSFTLKL